MPLVSKTKHQQLYFKWRFEMPIISSQFPLKIAICFICNVLGYKFTGNFNKIKKITFRITGDLFKFPYYKAVLSPLVRTPDCDIDILRTYMVHSATCWHGSTRSCMHARGALMYIYSGVYVNEDMLCHVDSTRTWQCARRLVLFLVLWLAGIMDKNSRKLTFFFSSLDLRAKQAARRRCPQRQVD